MSCARATWCCSDLTKFEECHCTEHDPSRLYRTKTRIYVVVVAVLDASPAFSLSA
jgi:hypothetical protein